MKLNLSLTLLFLMSFTVGFSQITEFLDERDNKTYEIIQVNKVLWFNNNLNYETEESSCYDDLEKNCELYGKLYNLTESKQVCPEGWRLPKPEEFYELIHSISTKSKDGVLELEGDWSDLENEKLIPFNFQFSGSKRKSKFKTINSLHFWLNDEMEGGHVHISKIKKKNKILISHHKRDISKAILKNKVKLAVRCVKEME